MAGLFSSAALEQIRAASDIVDVIGAYLPLKRAGANFVALCPFHKEKTPSFNVNPHRQIFHCFGCHKGGDVFTFVKEYENIDFVEAVKRLADRAKIPLEYEKDAASQQSRHLKDGLLQMHEQIAQRWQNALANEASGQIGRDYLAKRGVSAEAVKLFRIGCAPDAWDDTVNWAKSKGYDLALVEKAGLIIQKSGAGDHAPDATGQASDFRSSGSRNYYDRFRGRLMFPVCDEQGRVIAFSGRVLSGDEKTAKYVNSPETPIFTKSRVFFGLDKSKRAILDRAFAVICEGQLDLIACFMAGVQNVIAPQGTAFTAEHAHILKRYASEAVLCFDSDLAGQKASIRGLEGLLASDFARSAGIAFERSAPVRDTLLSSGFAIRVAILPSPHDPDSFIKQFGAPAFRELIEKAQPFFDFYLGHLCATNDIASDTGRIAAVKAMAETLHKTGNMVLLDTYAQKTAMRLAVSAESVRAEFKKAGRVKAPVVHEPEEEFEAAAETPRPPTPEFWLLKLLFLHEDLAGWCAAHLDPSWMEHPLARQIVSKRVEAHRNGTWTSLGAFLDGCAATEERNLVTEAGTEERVIPNPQQQISDVALRLRNQFIDRQLSALSQRVNQPQTDDATRVELLRQQQELRNLKRTAIGAERPAVI